MKPIELEILFFDKDEAQLDNIGIRPDINEIGTRSITFYNIDCIHPYYENDKNMSCVVCSGQEFICDMDYGELKNILLKHQQ